MSRQPEDHPLFFVLSTIFWFGLTILALGGFLSCAEKVLQ